MTKEFSIFPKADCNPYYIVSDPYTRVSAGIKSLHLLCHHLNLSGIPAYMIVIGKERSYAESSVEADFLTPILTQRSARTHFEKGKTPIMVYPETVAGNPYGSPCIVRYVLNFPGLLGGDKEYGKNELCFGYSKILAATTPYPKNIICIPASDTRIFFPPDTHVKREGSCFYASKYKREHNGKLFEITKHSTEITSRMPNSQSPEEIADLFRKSEVFYTYENTALALEARLCGCPAVFLPNKHLESIIGLEAFGSDGFAWGAAPEEIAQAKASVHKANKNYEIAINLFQKQLIEFINLTQVYSQDKKYSRQQYLELCQHIPQSPDTKWVVGEVGIKYRHYAPLLSKLPWKIEQKIGALLCSLGLTHDGEFLWNRAIERSKRNVEKDA